MTPGGAFLGEGESPWNCHSFWTKCGWDWTGGVNKGQTQQAAGRRYCGNVEAQRAQHLGSARDHFMGVIWGQSGPCPVHPPLPPSTPLPPPLFLPSSPPGLTHLVLTDSLSYWFGFPVLCWLQIPRRSFFTFWFLLFFYYCMERNQVWENLSESLHLAASPKQREQSASWGVPDQPPTHNSKSSRDSHSRSQVRWLQVAQPWQSKSAGVLVPTSMLEYALATDVWGNWIPRMLLSGNVSFGRWKWTITDPRAIYYFFY